MQMYESQIKVLLIDSRPAWFDKTMSQLDLAFWNFASVCVNLSIIGRAATCRSTRPLLYKGKILAFANQP